MTSGSTRQFMALYAIAGALRPPHTPTDQAWIKTLFGTSRPNGPTWTPSTTLPCCAPNSSVFETTWIASDFALQVPRENLTQPSGSWHCRRRADHEREQQLGASYARAQRRGEVGVVAGVVTGQLSQNEAARKWRVDRSTVVRIRRTAKDALLAAFAAAKPGRSSDPSELEEPAPRSPG
jgi:hypothetical protein